MHIYVLDAIVFEITVQMYDCGIALACGIAIAWLQMRSSQSCVTIFMPTGILKAVIRMFIQQDVCSTT